MPVRLKTLSHSSPGWNTAIDQRQQALSIAGRMIGSLLLGGVAILGSILIFTRIRRRAMVPGANRSDAVDHGSYIRNRRSRGSHYAARPRSPGSFAWVGPRAWKSHRRRLKVPYKYELIVAWSSEDSAFVVDVPELPGCTAHGATPAEAVANTQIGLWLDVARGQARPIPTSQRPAWMSA
jgi:predicted RNase H-like HicB family nuclease